MVSKQFSFQCSKFNIQVEAAQYNQNTLKITTIQQRNKSIVPPQTFLSKKTTSFPKSFPKMFQHQQSMSINKQSTLKNGCQSTQGIRNLELNGIEWEKMDEKTCCTNFAQL